jgi:protein farnesyltransferase/geranylgeranyltransferase type-1 subunit alpha
MLRKEHSARTLRLTEHVIKLNPAHYTVWLYRFSILSALNIPIPDEISWLNGIALSNLKNYQIWHHRHLLVDHYYPSIASDPAALASFAAAELDFLTEILERDTKNYHVWSYRSFLVRKLGMWKVDNERERRSIEALIEDDVRNNSAWSHRFFVVFNDPEQSTPGVAATEPDPAAPADIISREMQYAQDKIYLAPQNQSPWNYLRGVLVKGGRKLAEVEGFVKEFVQDVGEDGKEEVRSSHALDLLAEIYAEKGDKELATTCLRRLGEKWDPIRYGYWEWRRGMLEAES